LKGLCRLCAQKAPPVGQAGLQLALHCRGVHARPSGHPVEMFEAAARSARRCSRVLIASLTDASESPDASAATRRPSSPSTRRRSASRPARSWATSPGRPAYCSAAISMAIQRASGFRMSSRGASRTARRHRERVRTHLGAVTITTSFRERAAVVLVMGDLTGAARFQWPYANVVNEARRSTSYGIRRCSRPHKRGGSERPESYSESYEE